MLSMWKQGSFRIAGEAFAKVGDFLVASAAGKVGHFRAISRYALLARVRALWQVDIDLADIFTQGIIRLEIANKLAAKLRILVPVFGTGCISLKDNRRKALVSHLFEEIISESRPLGGHHTKHECVHDVGRPSCLENHAGIFSQDRAAIRWQRFHDLLYVEPEGTLQEIIAERGSAA